MSSSKVMSMSEAVARYVQPGDTMYLGGFIQQDPFAAVHEIIRQNIGELTVSACATLIPVDQLIGVGLVKRLITTFCWNLLPAPAHCFVRAATTGQPRPLEREEYSILSLSLGYFAGALGLPYVAAKTILGSDLDGEKGRAMGKNRLKFETSPFTGERVCLIPPFTHDVGIMQVQRADAEGNTQAWGLLGESKYGLLSCKRIIICAEEIVSSDVIRHDPNRTIIPGFRVDAVVEVPWGSHPASMTGHYDVDWSYFVFYERETRTPEGFKNFMDRWVYGVKDHREYLDLLGENRLAGLKLENFSSEPVPYGRLDTRYGV